MDIIWDEQLAGANAFEKYNSVLPECTLDSIKKNKVCLKAPITTPIGHGFASVNVQLRKYFKYISHDSYLLKMLLYHLGIVWAVII